MDAARNETKAAQDLLAARETSVAAAQKLTEATTAPLRPKKKTRRRTRSPGSSGAPPPRPRPSLKKELAALGDRSTTPPRRWIPPRRRPAKSRTSSRPAS